MGRNTTLRATFFLMENKEKLNKWNAKFRYGAWSTKSWNLVKGIPKMWRALGEGFRESLNRFIWNLVFIFGRLPGGRGTWQHFQHTCMMSLLAIVMQSDSVSWQFSILTFRNVSTVMLINVPTEQYYPTDSVSPLGCLYRNKGKSRAHSMLRKCFIWILLTGKYHFTMFEHRFDISVLTSIWKMISDYFGRMVNGIV